MERVKFIFWLMPFATLSVAIAYIQGYWGHFGIHAFPFLNVPELITYSAVPFFGVMFTLVFGMFGVFVGEAVALKSKRVISEDVVVAQKTKLLSGGLLFPLGLLFLIAGATWYIGSPTRWIAIPFAALAFSLVGPLFCQASRDWMANNLKFLSIAIPLLTLWLISFGFGRLQAEGIQRQSIPNALITLDTGSDSVRLLGKLGQFYFYMNDLDRIVVRPEQSVKSVEYLKMHFPTECMYICGGPP